MGGTVINTTTYSRVTLNNDYFYPVKTVSRSVTKRRIRRNIAYIFSVTFAFGYVTTLSPAFTLGAWRMAEHAPRVIAHTPVAPTPEIAVTNAVAPAQPAVIAHKIPSQIYPLTLELKVENGDTLTTILTDAGYLLRRSPTCRRRGAWRL